MVPWAQLSLSWHLDQFSSICRGSVSWLWFNGTFNTIHEHDQLTDRQTIPCYSVYSNRLHLVIAVMWPRNWSTFGKIKRSSMLALSLTQTG